MTNVSLQEWIVHDRIGLLVIHRPRGSDPTVVCQASAAPSRNRARQNDDRCHDTKLAVKSAVHDPSNVIFGNMGNLRFGCLHVNVIGTDAQQPRCAKGTVQGLSA